MRSVVFSPDGRQLAAGSSDRSVKLWDLNTCQELISLKGHVKLAGVEGLVNDSVGEAFSPDGRRMVTGGHDHTIRLWDATTGRESQIINRHHGPVSSVAFSPDGKLIASGSEDQTVKLWDAQTGRARMTRLATVSRDKMIKLWDASTGEELVTLKGHAGIVHTVTFSPDGKRLATGSVASEVLRRGLLPTGRAEDSAYELNL